MVIFVIRALHHIYRCNARIMEIRLQTNLPPKFETLLEKSILKVTMFADANDRVRQARHHSRGLRAPCREAPLGVFFIVF